jgi:hypothetical protein
VGSEAALPPEVLGHMFSSLSLPGLGRTRAVCSRWRDAGTLVAGPLWRQQAERLGYLYGWSETAVTRRARGDWRAFVKRELDLERRWTQPRGAALRCRVLTAWDPDGAVDARAGDVLVRRDRALLVARRRATPGLLQGPHRRSE